MRTSPSAWSTRFTDPSVDCENKPQHVNPWKLIHDPVRWWWVKWVIFTEQPLPDSLCSVYYTYLDQISVHALHSYIKVYVTLSLFTSFTDVSSTLKPERSLTSMITMLVSNRWPLYLKLKDCKNHTFIISSYVRKSFLIQCI